MNAHFEGSGPWTAWFGASPHRDLVYTVQNIGNVAVQDTPIIIAVGKGSDPTGIVRPPDLGTLAPGESQTYHTPVDLGAFAFGEYHAVGKIPGFAIPVEFSATTTTYPWGLILIVVLGVFELVLHQDPQPGPGPTRPGHRRGTGAFPGPRPALNPGPVLVGAGAAAFRRAAPCARTSSRTPSSLALSETLRDINSALGDRQLTDDEAARLAGGLAEEVSAAVAVTLSLSPAGTGRWSPDTCGPSSARRWPAARSTIGIWRASATAAPDRAPTGPADRHSRRRR